MLRDRFVRLLFAASAVGVPLLGFAQGPDVSRGKALYETRCVECHDRSVHARKPRSARSFAEIREYVLRWDRETGALWRADEVDAVTRYLNERYYQFPCPATLCSLERVQARTSPGRTIGR